MEKKTNWFSKDYWAGVTEVKFCPQEKLPPHEELPITAVSCLAITADRKQVVLAKVPRGYDLPGGHLEGREGPLQALSRELMEEVGGQFIGEPCLIGVRIMTRIKPHDRTKQYPAVSGIGVYLGVVTLQEEYIPFKEALGRVAVGFSEISRVHYHWGAQEEEIFEYVRRKYNSYFSDKD